mgnify:CR=1 FL=1
MKKHRASQSFLARKREKARLKKLRRLELRRQNKLQKQKKRDDYYGDI